MACRNAQLAKLRAHKREELLAATESNLLARSRPAWMRASSRGSDEIGVRVGKVINQYKVAKHFELTIGENSFSFARKHEAIAAEAALDGIYIIRTSVDATAHGCAQLRAQLQVAGQCRARVPLISRRWT